MNAEELVSNHFNKLNSIMSEQDLELNNMEEHESSAPVQPEVEETPKTSGDTEEVSDVQPSEDTTQEEAQESPEVSEVEETPEESPAPVTSKPEASTPTEETPEEVPSPVSEPEAEEQLALEGVKKYEGDDRIERILRLNHYYGHLSAGRFLSNASITDENLKEFYIEFVTNQYLTTKEDYDLVNLLEEKFGVLSEVDDEETPDEPQFS